jgi:DNA-nicking Smr family endonuclease
MFFDATLDFHDKGKLTSEQVSFLLEQFLLSASQEGYKHLLVITGKGVDSSGLVRKVVLKDLRHNKLIASFRIASPEAGGSGAFEVYLAG